MNALVRAALFVVALSTVFVAAWGVGKAYDDGDAKDPGAYSLRLSASQAEPSPAVAISFAVLDPEERVVTDFAVKHEKRLHLIAVARDFSGYRHLHPTMDAEGSWTIDADLTGGAWRLFADFKPVGGDDEVVHTDLDVAGETGPPATDEPTRTASVDGYGVRVTGDLVAGEGTMLAFEISDPSGKPVTDLEPYLGAFGHLVALREKDLEYLHVHPEDGPAGPEIRFHVEVPTAGLYRLYLDFQHDGVVRSVPFLLDAAPASDAGHGGHDMDEMDHGDH